MRERGLKNVFVLFTDLDTVIIFKTYLEAAKIDSIVFHIATTWDISPFTDFDPAIHLLTVIVEFSYLTQLKKILRDVTLIPVIIALPSNSSQ